MRNFLTYFVITWAFIIFPIHPAISVLLSSHDYKDNQVFLAQKLKESGYLLNQVDSDLVKGNAADMVSNAATNEIQNWLANAGTVRTKINLDKDFNILDPQLELLIPWYENQNGFMFTQHSIHRTDKRLQINNGLGYRFTGQEWMSGINVFYDYDISDRHSRLGVGGELWRDYFKAGVNGYYRLSGWRNASGLNDEYYARPANGWDVRIDAWLPSYPHLGGNLKYEQYYGNEVALVDKNNRTKNPKAVTAGVEWTPFPLLTIGAEYTAGNNGIRDTSGTIKLSWTPGMSLSQHFDPDMVTSRRTLAGSKLDLVERNNNIILDYKKKELITLLLKESIEGHGKEKISSVVVSVKTKYPLKNIEWTAPDFIAAGGKIIPTGNDATFVLPDYRLSEKDVPNTYSVQAYAIDSRGNRSAVERMTVVVNQSALHASDIKINIINDNAEANGTDPVQLVAVIRDQYGDVMQNIPVSFTFPPELEVSETNSSVSKTSKTNLSVNKNSTVDVITDSNGNGFVSFVSLHSGEFEVSGKVNTSNSTISSLTKIHFTGSVDDAKSSVTATPDTIIADGSSASQVLVTLSDTNGNPVAGEKLSLSTTLGSVSAVTDNGDGTYSATLTSSTTAGTATVSVDGHSSLTATVKMSPDDSTAQLVKGSLSVTRDGALADGQDANTVEARVADANGNPLAGQTVTFTADNGAVITASANSDASGIVTATLTSQKAGTVNVTAAINGSTESVVTHFINGSVDDAKSSVTATPDTIIADGSSASQVLVTLSDTNGNPVAGEKLSLSTTLGSVSAVTDNGDGTYSATLTSSTTAGTATVSVDGHSSLTVTVHLNQRYIIKVNHIKANSVANGIDYNTDEVTLTDGLGNPIAGELMIHRSVGDSSFNMTFYVPNPITDANGKITINTSCIFNDNAITKGCNYVVLLNSDQNYFYVSNNTFIAP